MPITFPCSGCDARMRVSRRFAGKRGQCPSCGERVLIPNLPGSDSGSDAVVASPAPPTPSPGLATPPSRDLQEFTDSGSGVRPMAEDATPAQVGKRYEIREELARGGMGVVYVAHDPDLDRPVAIKQLLGSSDKHRKRFRREAKAVARLQHPNIVRVYDVVEDGGQLYMVMDLIDGESLGDRLERIGSLDPELSARIAWQTAQALHYAHAAGILHRDVKPGNVLLAKDGEVKLTDFGLAKSFDLTDDELTLDATPEGGVRPITDMKMTVGVRSLTADGHVMGTPAYMSPEQAKGEKLDPRSDVFSLGSTLYQMLTGEPPFTAPRLTMLLKSVLHDDPERIRKQQPDVPKELEKICLRCLAKRPEDRYPDADALARDLRGFLDGRRTKSGVKKKRRRRRASDAAVPSASSSSGVRAPLTQRLESLPPWASWAALGGFVLLGVLAGVVASAVDGDDPPPPVASATPDPTASPSPDAPPDDGLYRYRGRTVAEWVADLGAADRVPRVTAAQALKAIGPPQAEAAQAALLSVLNDEDEAVARTAAQALAPLSLGEEAVEPLDRLAHRRLGEPAGEAAIEALAAIGPPAVLALGGLAERSDLGARAPQLKRQVEAALARLVPGARDRLLRWLQASASRERRIAATVLGRLGPQHGKPAVLPLCKALADTFEAVAIRAARSLGSIQDRRAVGPLTKALLSGGTLLTRAAAEALQRLGGHAVEDAVTALVKRLGGPSADERKRARAALRALPRGVARAQDAIARLRRADPAAAARAQAGLRGGRTYRDPPPRRDPPRRDPPRRDPPRRALKLTSGSNALQAFAARRTRPGKLTRGEAWIEPALAWLARHQAPDGRWSAAGFTARCRDRSCRSASGQGVVGAFDTGITGLALLAFLGHGHTHRGGPYAQTVARGLQYLASSVSGSLRLWERPGLSRVAHGSGAARVRQVNKTRVLEWATQPKRGWAQVYELALAAAAVRDAAALTRDPALLVLSARLRRQILAAQNPGLGWGYGSRTGRNDSSITCWMLTALQADPSDRTVGEGIQGGWNWLYRATDSRGRTGYQSPGGGSSFLQTNLVRTSSRFAPYASKFQLPSLSAHALWVALGADERGRSRRVRGWLRSQRREALKLLLEHLPAVGASTTSYYYWFVGSHALALRGSGWSRWRRALEPALQGVRSRSARCAAGSFEPVGEWCSVGGRVYATAISALTLQAPYRLKR